MICTISEFEQMWQARTADAKKLFAALNDASLSVSAGPEERTVGRVAWHVIQTIPEMMERVGLPIEGPGPSEAVPGSAETIRQAFERASGSLLAKITESWTDATLAQTDDMYGEVWTRGQTLTALVLHQVHHLGQLTVLMRIAGLKVPGIFGPAREEWGQYGMPQPEI
jgi:uncharacterized damage-inducible protein DinB